MTVIKFKIKTFSNHKIEFPGVYLTKILEFPIPGTEIKSLTFSCLGEKNSLTFSSTAATPSTVFSVQGKVIERLKQRETCNVAHVLFFQI